MGRKKKKTSKPWCWYCNREFEDEKILLQHQKAKHFKCHICHKKLFTGPGLQIHCMQVHKENIDRVPNSIKGRDNITLEICGMENVPEEDLIEHEKQKRLKDKETESDSDSNEEEKSKSAPMLKQPPLPSQPPPPPPPALPSSLPLASQQAHLYSQMPLHMGPYAHQPPLPPPPPGSHPLMMSHYPMLGQMPIIPPPPPHSSQSMLMQHLPPPPMSLGNIPLISNTVTSVNTPNTMPPGPHSQPNVQALFSQTGPNLSTSALNLETTPATRIYHPVDEEISLEEYRASQPKYKYNLSLASPSRTTPTTTSSSAATTASNYGNYGQIKNQQPHLHQQINNYHQHQYNQPPFIFNPATTNNNLSRQTHFKMNQNGRY